MNPSPAHRRPVSKILAERAKIVRSMSPEELGKAIYDKTIFEKLGIKSAKFKVLGRGRPTQKRTTLVNTLIAAGIRDAKGTAVGDALKAIASGKQITRKTGPEMHTIMYLRIAGIIDINQHGRIVILDCNRLLKSAKEQRIVWP